MVAVAGQDRCAGIQVQGDRLRSKWWLSEAVAIVAPKRVVLAGASWMEPLDVAPRDIQTSTGDYLFVQCYFA